jgi:glycosyltransferase involved in cell wall biosynthesis
MRIVYITNASFLDHSYTIVKELKKQCEVYAFIQAKEESGELREWCSRLNASFVKRKRYRNPLSFVAEFKFLLSVRKYRADKIWFNGISVYQAVIAKILLRNYLVMIHDVESHLGSKDYFSLLSSNLHLFFLKKRICTASLTQASVFEKKFGFLPVVFRLPIINYYSDVGISAKSEHADSKNVRFFFFGSVYPYKGMEMLIEALEILSKKRVNCSLSVLGRIKYNYDFFKSKFDGFEHVNFIDKYIDYKEVYKIYCSHDVLIIPYRQVSQCGPLLIGFNELVPVICSDLPGFREYVDDGKSGLIFRNSSSDLAEKMMMFINKPGLINEMKQFIETKTFRKFSMENLADKYIENLSDFKL